MRPPPPWRKHPFGTSPHGRPCAAIDEARLRQVGADSSVSTFDAAREFRCSPSTVTHHCAMRGIEWAPKKAGRPAGAGVVEIDLEWLRERALRPGVTQDDVAEATGYSIGAIRVKWAQARRPGDRWVTKVAKPQPEAAWPLVIDAEHLRRLAADSEVSSVEAGRRLGCSPTTVFNRCTEWGIEWAPCKPGRKAR